MGADEGVSLSDLIDHYGFAGVLRFLSRIMEDRGAITSGIIKEAAEIEEKFLEASDGC